MTPGGSDLAPAPPPREADPADAAEAEALRPPPRAEPEDAEMGGEAPCQLHRFWNAGEA